MPLRTIIIKATRSGTASTVIIRRGASGTGTGGGVTDHGALTGREDDDHTQYFNQTRGDARYAPIASPTFTGNATADQFNTSEGAAYSTSGIQFLAGAGPGNVSYNVSFSAGDPTATRSMALPDANGTLAVTSRSDGKIVATDIFGILPITSGGTNASSAGAAATNLGLGTGNSPTFAGQTLTGAIVLPQGTKSIPSIIFTGLPASTGFYYSNGHAGMTYSHIGSDRVAFTSNQVIISSTSLFAFSSGTNLGLTDTGISRKTATPGTLMIGNGAANNASGSLELTNLTASGAIILPTSTTPLSAGAAGVAGTIVRDASYLYVCTATNTWTRIALAW